MHALCCNNWTMDFGLWTNCNNSNGFWTLDRVGVDFGHGLCE